MAKILLQFPEGLKREAFELKKELEKKGEEVYVSSTPCFGACDLAFEEAKALKVDKIIHFGHNKFIKGKEEVPVEYIPYRVDIDLSSLTKAVEELKKRKVEKFALVTTVQHSHQIKEMKEFFEKQGLSPFTSRGFWAREEGQILGCDVKAGIIEGVENVLYVGTGLFHPLAFYGVEKRVFVFNPFSKEFSEITERIKRAEKTRKSLITRALYANKFLILVSTKPGQHYPKRALWVKKELEKVGKEALIVVSNTFDKDSLFNFMADAYVNTACPRIMDDFEAYEKPILNLDMVVELLSLMKKKDKVERGNALYWIEGNLKIKK